MIDVLLYADDIVLLTNTINDMQKLLDATSSYGRDNDMVFNASKTNYMIFNGAKVNGLMIF